MIDLTLTCEDGNSKLVEVVAVVDIDDKILKLLGSGPDMAAELKDGDRIEGGPEGGLPQRSFGGQAAVEEVPQYHHRPSQAQCLWFLCMQGMLQKGVADKKERGDRRNRKSNV